MTKYFSFPFLLLEFLQHFLLLFIPIQRGYCNFRKLNRSFGINILCYSKALVFICVPLYPPKLNRFPLRQINKG